MNLSDYSPKQVGSLGESVAALYLKRHGFSIVARNIARKTGELDIVAREGDTLHIIEVKTLLCDEFSPDPDGEANSRYDPGDNLHAYKIHKVARTGEWYVADIGWEGEWQLDGVLVWLRRRDGAGRVRYLPQIL